MKTKASACLLFIFNLVLLSCAQLQRPELARELIEKEREQQRETASD
jgi:hypothetical protein